MSLESALKKIGQLEINAQETISQFIPEDDQSGVLQLMRGYAFARKKEAVKGHLERYPHHKEIVLGKAATLTERAVAYLQKEFWNDENKRRYVWRLKKFKDTIREHPVTQEILAVRTDELEVFLGGSGNRYLMRSAVGACAGMFTGLGVLAGMRTYTDYDLSNVNTYLVVWGTLGLGLLASYALPVKVDLRQYIHAATAADQYLQKTLRELL